jgi:hypothetical protein
MRHRDVGLAQQPTKAGPDPIIGPHLAARLGPLRRTWIVLKPLEIAAFNCFTIRFRSLACEIRLRAERKAGQLLQDMDKLKGRPKKASTDTTLSDLGISRDQSSRCGSMPTPAIPMRSTPFGGADCRVPGTNIGPAP